MTPKGSKYHTEIVALLFSAETLTEEERKYLYKAKTRLENGQDPDKVLNELGLALKALDFGRIQVNGLTPNVKIFFEKMKEELGEPTTYDLYAENLAKIPGAVTKYNQSTILLSIIIIIFLIVCRYFLHL